MSTRVDDVQEPKHTVFLCHSGAQKDFVYQLWVDLRRVSYVPFFDKDRESLERGDEFPVRIFDAIRHCLVFVFVLSEDFFTKTKWPMMELAAAVEALSENPNLKLLPLFFKITVSQFKEKDRRARWSECWKKWESSRVDVPKWEEALKEVEKFDSILYENFSFEVEYRKDIVESICRICPNNLFDVSHVVGREKICQIVAHKFGELKRESQRQVKVLRIGLFGMGGLGKTTSCKVMCNHYFADFGGNVIHVDLQSNAIVEHQKKVIGKLTGAPPAIDDPTQGHLRLKTIFSTHKVFLALDNVIDDPAILKEVTWYLNLPYGMGSMVLVTSRSFEVLLSKLKIPESHCLEVPDLDVKEAISLFLQEGPSTKDLEFSSYGDDEQNRIVEGVGKALFPRTLRSGEQFHPLALKALASTLSELIDEPEQWRSTFDKLDLKYTGYRVHPIFSILGSSFEMLPDKDKLIFMDIAIFKPSCAIFKEDVCKWLEIVHKIEYKDFETHLKNLRLKSVVDEGPGDEVGNPINIDGGSTSIETSETGGAEEIDLCSGPQVVVHDLYVELAKLESGSDSLNNMLYFARENFDDLPPQMQEFPSAGPCWPLKRIALTRGSLRGPYKLTFREYYKNVNVLKLEYLAKLTEVDVEGMFCLASVDIFFCNELRTIRGLQTLKILAWLRVARCEMLEDLPTLQNLCSMKHVEIRNTRKILNPIISNCPQLYELRLSDHGGVEDLSNIQALPALEKVMIEWCQNLRTFPMLKDCRLLRELYVVDCPTLCGVMEIGSLVALKKLHLRNTNICELRGIGLTTGLCELVCEYCPELGGVLEVGKLFALQKLHLTNIAVKELNGIGKLTCLSHFVWKQPPKLGCELPNPSGLTDLAEFTKLTKFINLGKLDIRVHSRTFTLEDVQPLRCIRNFLQGKVACKSGDVDHVMDIMTQHLFIGVERHIWSFVMVPNTFDADLEGTEVDNDNFGTAEMIPQVTGMDVKLQTTLRLIYGVSLEHVNEYARRMGRSKGIVSFAENMFQGLNGPAMSTLSFGNIDVLYLDNLEIGHLQLIGMKCLSKLYIRRCKRLLRPIILEAMLVLEDVKMVDCEYLDDDCIGMRIQNCARLREVTITNCKKLRPIFVSKPGNHLDFQNLPIEDMSDIQISTNAMWTNIEWYHNMHGKVNIECCDNMLNGSNDVYEFGLLLFKMYVLGVVPGLATGVMNMMIDCRAITNDSGQLCCWTLIVLQSSCIAPDEDFMSNFDSILGRSSILNIALEFARQDLKTKLCFFSGVLCEQVLRNLPNKWTPTRIVSFTGDRFQILNQEKMSKRFGNINVLHLNDIEFANLDLQGLECVERLELQKVRNLTIGPIILEDMPTLEYIKLVDLEYGIYCSPALSINNCPRLQEVILDKCSNVRNVFKNNTWENRLPKLFIKDCPDLLDIFYQWNDIYFIPQVQCINCPKWQRQNKLNWVELIVGKLVTTMAKAEIAMLFMKTEATQNVEIAGTKAEIVTAKVEKVVIETIMAVNATIADVANVVIVNAANAVIVNAAVKATHAAVKAANAAYVAVKATNAAVKAANAAYVAVKGANVVNAMTIELLENAMKAKNVAIAAIMTVDTTMAVANKVIAEEEVIMANEGITSILDNEPIMVIMEKTSKNMIAARAAIMTVDTTMAVANKVIAEKEVIMANEGITSILDNEPIMVIMEKTSKNMIAARAAIMLVKGWAIKDDEAITTDEAIEAISEDEANEASTTDETIEAITKIVANATIKAVMAITVDEAIAVDEAIVANEMIAADEAIMAFLTNETIATNEATTANKAIATNEAIMADKASTVYEAIVMR